MSSYADALREARDFFFSTPGPRRGINWDQNWLMGEVVLYSWYFHILYCINNIYCSKLIYILDTPICHISIGWFLIHPIHASQKHILFTQLSKSGSPGVCSTRRGARTTRIPWIHVPHGIHSATFLRMSWTYPTQQSDQNSLQTKKWERHIRIYWLNMAIFIHFSISFVGQKKKLCSRPWVCFLVFQLVLDGWKLQVHSQGLNISMFPALLPFKTFVFPCWYGKLFQFQEIEEQDNCD